MKQFVTKLVKSFGRLRDTSESLDDFRYTKACFIQEKVVHGVGLCPSTYLRFVLCLFVFTWGAARCPTKPNGDPMRPQALNRSP
jgi:hypothetical protein